MRTSARDKCCPPRGCQKYNQWRGHAIAVGGDIPPRPPGNSSTANMLKTRKHTVTVKKRSNFTHPHQRFLDPPLSTGIRINFIRTVQAHGCVINERICAFLSRVSTVTRDIDIAILSVCPSVRHQSVCDTLVLYENGLTYRHSFSPYGSPIILVLPASNIFTKFRRGHPLRGR